MKTGEKIGALGIRGRLFMGFFMLVLPIVCVILFFLYKINQIENFAWNMSNVIIPTRAVTSHMRGEIYNSQLALYESLLTQDLGKKEKYKQVWEEIKQNREKMGALILKNYDKKLVQIWEDLSLLYPTLHTAQMKLLQEKTSSDNANIKKIIQEEMDPLMLKIYRLIEGKKTSTGDREDGMINIQLKELSSGAQKILNDIDDLKLMNYGFLIVILVLAFVIAWLTAKKIIKPIQAFSEHSTKVAAGDLRQRVSIASTDELGLLGQDLNTMTESLSEITRKLIDSSKQMTSILEEAKQASEMQSTGVSEQASSINEITASLEEIDKSANQTMEKAKALGKISEETSQKGQMGLDAVQHSIEGMKSIHDKVETIAKTILELSNQTQQIGEITTVVNTLALQSKMLALNASIEAAKAGDAGKGFAVVASEVKNLAEQSEQSTTQVQKILEDIRHGTEKAVIVTEEGAKGVAEGTSVVEQMGDIMQSLTEAINETMLASQQIEAAVRQESLGIEQITVGMNEINQVTASFVNTVKQTTDLIGKLGDMALSIKNYVETYKI